MRALAPAESASSRDELGVSSWSLPELVEAATRCGKRELAAVALQSLSDRTRAAGTEGRSGSKRGRALLCEGELAEALYREAIERLGRCRVTLELTAQEAQIARLANMGHTNPEIGAQLFISPRTVEWHLRRVFTKLGISSRNTS